jgi:hypothetical protein
MNAPDAFNAIVLVYTAFYLPIFLFGKSHLAQKGSPLMKAQCYALFLTILCELVLGTDDNNGIAAQKAVTCSIL